jgi:hypothetical protein
MAVTTAPLTGHFAADRTHSSFQFAVRHMMRPPSAPLSATSPRA